MKKLILVASLFLVLMAGIVFSLDESDSRSISRIGHGVTCEVICNGECPEAPSGWVLSESLGESGTGTYVYGAAGRCVYREGSQISEGIERMCCYFQQ
jgi:hypothetical protein